MENDKISVWKATLNTGIYLGLVLILYTLILYFTNQITNKVLSSGALIILIVGLYLGINSFKKNFRGGYLTYGQVLGAGVVISLYTYILTAIFVYVLYAYIDPGLVQKMIAMAQDKLAAKGLSDNQIEMSMKLSSKFMKPAIMAVSSIFNGVFYGTIITLILGIFLKREGAPSEEMPIEGEEQ